MCEGLADRGVCGAMRGDRLVYRGCKAGCECQFALQRGLKKLQNSSRLSTEENAFKTGSVSLDHNFVGSRACRHYTEATMLRPSLFARPGFLARLRSFSSSASEAVQLPVIDVRALVDPSAVSSVSPRPARCR